jgi:hypothetical protein
MATQKWEYMTLKVRKEMVAEVNGRKEPSESLSKSLNDYGSQGWKLGTVLQYPVVPGDLDYPDPHFILILERSKEE